MNIRDWKAWNQLFECIIMTKTMPKREARFTVSFYGRCLTVERSHREIEIFDEHNRYAVVEKFDADDARLELGPLDQVLPRLRGPRPIEIFEFSKKTNQYEDPVTTIEDSLIHRHYQYVLEKLLAFEQQPIDIAF